MPAFINILLRLRERDRTSFGCNLDIAMTDAMLRLRLYLWHKGQGLGPLSRGPPGRGGASDRRQSALWPLCDGGWLVPRVGVDEEILGELLRRIGLAAELRDDRRDPAACACAVTATIASQPAEHWRVTIDARFLLHRGPNTRQALAART